MSKNNLHKVLLLFLSCFLVLALSAPVLAAPAGNYENGMLTSPPPEEDLISRYVPIYSGSGSTEGDVSPQGAFQPWHIYLDRGEASIGVDSGNTKLLMSGATYANQYVEEVGVRLTLQRWTGSYWTDVYNSADGVLTDAVTTAWSDEYSPVKGYYYRTKGTHWVNESGTHEEGNTYTNYIAFN